MWLERSAAWMRERQKQGSSSSAETAAYASGERPNASSRNSNDEGPRSVGSAAGAAFGFVGFAFTAIG